jgi:hypothetical protein
MANIDPAKALNEPSEILFVCPLELGTFDNYLERLITAIGPACYWGSEEEFCEYMGCAPWNLEDWLSRDWIQHFPHLVLSLEDVPGPVPWVLYKVSDNEQKVRVFSASPELAEYVRSPREVRVPVQ